MSISINGSSPGLQANMTNSVTEAKTEAKVASLAKTQQELEGHMVNTLLDSSSQSVAPSATSGVGQSINIKV
ncbi:hypothetical protein [Thalassomonas haliotis]|uniref:Motility protein n=1 Tax=Thalassomonas haliotis TaxID=485448 RepID=A0ABY7VNR0_9GAMM|nr:hypothetical protein [Thalassomonas haliotis]WDE14694.1 hypothetical protein H3N35_15140 [Thalassomonas haliotis]